MLCDLLESYEMDRITLFQTFCATGVTNAINAILKDVIKQWPAITKMYVSRAKANNFERLETITL